MSKKVIVFAPHPDDETFGCGGTIAKKVSEGCEVLIIVMTDGRHALSEVFGIDSDPTPNELMEVRKKEVKRATKILGVREENLIFLDFIDGMLEKKEKEAQEKVDEILAEKPPPIEVYFPYEKDCNIDHRVANRLVRNSIKKLGLRTMEYRYTVLRMYARVGPLIDTFFNLFRRNMIRVDVSKFLPLKKAAVEEFKSQILIMSNRQERPITAKFRNFLKKEEIFYIDK